MSKKRKQSKKGRRESEFNPDISRGVTAILLVVLAIIIVLSFFGAAGTIGELINNLVLGSLFGNLRYLSPVGLLLIAWILVKSDEYDYEPIQYVGGILFFVVTGSLFHIGFAPEEMWQQALAGNGGGFVGMPAWLLSQYLGVIAGVVILVGLLLVSLLLIFNNAIAHALIVHKAVLGSFGVLGRGLSNMARALFVPNEKNNIDHDDDYDDEEDEYDMYDDEMEEEEEDDEPVRSRFTGRHLSSAEEESEAEEEDEPVAEEEEDADLRPRNSDDDDFGADDVTYMQNVVIKPIPPLSLLSNKRGKPTSGDIKEYGRIIEETFNEFNIEVEMADIQVGPTVTQYTLRPPRGVKLSRITALSNNLALNLAAHPIRIEAPIPGKALVGIEVPNQKTAMVTLRELLESKEFSDRKHNMMIALGKDVAGKVWFADLPRMPHLLIAGATGSGKTVCVNTILMSLLYQNTAETLRMILVDPKRVELTPYNGIPHLLTPVITNPAKTVNALKWAVGEMERRFEVLQKAGNRDITSYNKAHPDTKLPHIIFVIDELADLMATSANDVEAGIIRLAQMARAIGIHLIIATQRPSVDVITGIMKANIPGRIAFSVASLTDSRTILDGPGAEKLIGRGDMLLQTAELSKPVRIQDAFISEKEVKAVIKRLKGGEKPEYDESIVEKQQAGGTMSMFGGPSDDQDPLFHEAKQTVLEAGKASASFLQRKLRVGYARAARILDELEEAGVIGPSDGSKPRDILVDTLEDIDNSRGMDMGREENVFEEEDIAAAADDADESTKDMPDENELSPEDNADDENRTEQGGKDEDISEYAEYEDEEEEEEEEH